MDIWNRTEAASCRPAADLVANLKARHHTAYAQPVWFDGAGQVRLRRFVTTEAASCRPAADTGSPQNKR